VADVSVSEWTGKAKFAAVITTAKDKILFKKSSKNYGGNRESTC
jgi:hypothetical protein